MRFEKAKKLDKEKFRRLTGVKRSTFDQMISILLESHKTKKARGGRTNKLRIEDMLLMSLEYLKEYRTYFHISQSYNVSESTAYRTIRWVKYMLIKHPLFCATRAQRIIKKR